MTDKILIDRSVLEQALEALERNTIRMPVHLDYHFEAIKALRAALEQPQPQQPLTDEQVMQAVRHLYQSDVAAGMGFPDDLYVARAIEAAHGIGE